jgi:DNA-binding CsgD family transcriptional regulator
LDGHIYFNKLSSGKHLIDIFIYENGKAKRVYSHSLQIAKPWYLSSVMILLYLIFFGVILYLYYRWNHIRFQEKLKIKNEELKHQKKIFEMELDSQNAINAKELEKHLLEIQVQNKASEVAVKSLSLAKHGEMIANIEEILKTEKNIDIQKARIRKIIKIASLDENAWKSFEDDLIRSNRDFVERLLHRYPSLSSKDLKLCIYLRMNLSSKEIAPLMNISFRGVELHRYRLRKKMGIETDINLNNLMLGI